jgi:hypothetical protein
MGASGASIFFTVAMIRVNDDEKTAYWEKNF